MIILIRYFDMFAGIGGFRAGLTLAGGFTCIGHCEIDKYANKSYEAAHFPKESEVYYPDATKIDEKSMPDFDLLCAGFPCQSFSIAGKRKGFEDTRGTMFFEIARILRHKKPPYVLLENVPGLLSHDQGKTFAVIAGTLCELGYSIEWIVYNSKDFGVPQSRRRVFIIGYLDPRCAGKILPFRSANAQALIRIAGQGQGTTLYDGKGVACTQTTNGRPGLYFIDEKAEEKVSLIQLSAGPQGSRIYDSEGLACTQTSGAGGQGGKTGLYFVDDNKAIRFIDLCCGNPEITDLARCLTATYNNGLRYHKGEKSGVIKLGNTNPSGRGQSGEVYDSEGISPTLTTNKGAGIKVMVDDEQNMPEYDSVQAVLTPDREKVRQQGRRIKSNGEPMFTLTSQDKHGVLLIKEATKRGYKEAGEGDTVDLGYAGSNTRRGRIGKDIAHTLDTGSTQGVVRHGRIRRLMPRECLRLQGFPEDMIDRILAITSDAQAYKQAGNSVTVNVIEAIGRRIKAVDDELKGGDAVA